jgi:hypothetical protein
MTRRTLVAPLALALAAGALIAPASSGAASGCASGLTKVAGKKAMRYCGPATATAKVGGTTIRFSGGSCASSASALTVNIGTIAVSATPNVKPLGIASFGLTISPDITGVHLNQAIAWVKGGKRFSVFANHATVAASLEKGTFEGKLYPTGAKVTGTFAC